MSKRVHRRQGQHHNDGQQEQGAQRAKPQKRSRVGRMFDRLFGLPALLTSAVSDSSQGWSFGDYAPHYGVERLEPRVLLDATLGVGEFTVLGDGAGPDVANAVVAPARPRPSRSMSRQPTVRPTRPPPSP
jgi:hypothetical protein